MLYIWFFSFLSTIAGSAIVYLDYPQGNGYGYLLFGIAHFIVLFPAMKFTGVRTLTVINTSLLCLLFPVWGLIIGVPCVARGAPIMCSIAWGLVLKTTLRRRWAFWIMLLVGVASNAALFLSDSYSDFDMLYASESQLPRVYYTWFALMFFAMPLIMSFKPSPLSHRFTGKDICPNCGYSLIGLGPEAVCPECGDARVADTQRGGINWSVPD